MKTIYELWDRPSRNLIDAFPSERAALDQVRAWIAQGGAASVDGVALLAHQEGGTGEVIAEDAALARLAEAQRAHLIVRSRVTDTPDEQRAARSAGGPRSAAGVRSGTRARRPARPTGRTSPAPTHANAAPAGLREAPAASVRPRPSWFRRMFFGE